MRSLIDTVCAWAQGRMLSECGSRTRCQLKNLRKGQYSTGHKRLNQVPAAFTINDPVQLLGFVLLCKLILIYGLICGFCSSGQSFSHQGTFGPLKSGFLQIPPHNGHPCLWLSLPATGRLRDFHPRERALTGRTRKRLSQNANCKRIAPAKSQTKS